MLKKLSKSQKMISRYNNDCSAKGVARNFIKIRKDAAVSKPISTGSVIGDWAITQIPVLGKGIKYTNQGYLGGATIAHGIAAYKESCGKRKKK